MIRAANILFLCMVLLRRVAGSHKPLSCNPLIPSSRRRGSATHDIEKIHDALALEKYAVVSAEDLWRLLVHRGAKFKDVEKLEALWDLAVPQQDETGNVVYPFKGTLTSYYELDTAVVRRGRKTMGESAHPDNFDECNNDDTTDCNYHGRDEDEGADGKPLPVFNVKRSLRYDIEGLPGHVCEFIDDTTVHGEGHVAPTSNYRIHKAWPDARSGGDAGGGGKEGGVGEDAPAVDDNSVVVALQRLLFDLLTHNRQPALLASEVTGSRGSAAARAKLATMPAAAAAAAASGERGGAIAANAATAALAAAQQDCSSGINWRAAPGTDAGSTVYEVMMSAFRVINHKHKHHAREEASHKSKAVWGHTSTSSLDVAAPSTHIARVLPSPSSSSSSCFACTLQDAPCASQHSPTTAHTSTNVDAGADSPLSHPLPPPLAALAGSGAATSQAAAEAGGGPLPVLGEPGPEGVHQDSAELTLVLLMRRRNVAPGTGGNRVWTLDQPCGKLLPEEVEGSEGNLLCSTVLGNQFDALIVLDREVKHEARPFEPCDPAAGPAVRDVLTFEVRRPRIVPAATSGTQKPLPPYPPQ